MTLLSVEEALSCVLDGAEPLASEMVGVAQAAGRVLASDLAAQRTQPPADVSAMDGYAVRAADVATAPARLTLAGEVAAGRPFAGTVGPGQAVRIFTGGVMPAGADTVVIQERTERDGTIVTVAAPVKPRANVRMAALDFRTGAVLLRRGRRLSGRDVSLAAAMNHGRIPVYRRPAVAILATGDELVAPGSVPGPGQIISSNALSLSALAQGEGAQVTDRGIVGDDLDATAAAVAQARTDGADILVSSGGASVGDYDLMQKALATEGMTLSFWRVALRPGRPMMHGRLGSMRVLGLPGNPVSAYVCGFLFMVPLIRRLTGRSDERLVTESATLGVDLVANDERADYLRASLARGADGESVATPMPIQDSSMLVPLANADCLLIRPPFAPPARAGSKCTIIKLGL